MCSQVAAVKLVDLQRIQRLNKPAASKWIIKTSETARLWRRTLTSECIAAPRKNKQMESTIRHLDLLWALLNGDNIERNATEQSAFRRFHLHAPLARVRCSA
jgi:hypothetical protein